MTSFDPQSAKVKLSDLAIHILSFLGVFFHCCSFCEHYTSRMNRTIFQTVLFPFTAAAAKSLQSCPTLCDPIDGSPPRSSVPGILQARTLEWVAISFSNAWKWKVKVKSLSRVQLLATSWTAAYQAPPSMGFSRQEYWSGVPLPSPFPFTNCSYIHLIHSYQKFCITYKTWGYYPHFSLYLRQITTSWFPG